MTTITNFMVTDFFLNNYSSAVSWNSANAKIGVKLYTRAPVISERSYQSFKTVTTLADIAQKPEWVEIKSNVVSRSNGSAASLYLEKDTVSTDQFFRLTLSTTPQSPTVTANLDGTTTSGWYIEPSSGDYSQELIVCAIFYIDATWTVSSTAYVNPVIGVSTQGIGSRTVVQNGTIFGQASSNASGNEHLFKLDANNNFYAGYIYMKPAPPIWENAHAQHIWVEPQRINYIANPSFENLASDNKVFGWRTGNAATVTTPLGGLDSIPSRKRYLRVTRAITGSRVVLESNLFPRDSKWLSVSFNIRGIGTVRFGIVNFDTSYCGGTYLRSEDLKIINSSFYNFTALVPNTDFSTEALFRIEVDAATFWVDDVLVDPHEGQYEYFDGSSIEGLPGDFRWVNGEANQQFSVWYNNYSNTSTRLIGAWDYVDVSTDRPKGSYKTGLVDEWIPTGANVIVHWDAVSSFTPKNWLGNAYYQISDVAGTPVTTGLTELDFNLKPY